MALQKHKELTKPSNMAKNSCTNSNRMFRREKNVMTPYNLQKTRHFILKQAALLSKFDFVTKNKSSCATRYFCMVIHKTGIM